jgi:hypothetical protein
MAATAAAERETPFLDAYVPGLRGTKASLQQARRLRLVPPPLTNVPPTIAAPLTTIDTSLERLLSILQKLENLARTSAIDFEAVIYELRGEEREKFSDTIEDDKQCDQAKRLAEEYRKLFIEGLASREQMDAAQNFFDEISAIATMDRKVYEAYKHCRQNLEQLRDERLREYSIEWFHYLDNLESVFPVNFAQAVREMWTKLDSEHLWPPTAALRDESLLLLWDRGQHHLEIEVFSSGLYDWFYRDRSDNSFTGGEDIQGTEIPLPLKAAVRKTRKA